MFGKISRYIAPLVLATGIVGCSAPKDYVYPFEADNVAYTVNLTQTNDRKNRISLNSEYYTIEAVDPNGDGDFVDASVKYCGDGAYLTSVKDPRELLSDAFNARPKEDK